MYVVLHLKLFGCTGFSELSAGTVVFDTTRNLRDRGYPKCLREQRGSGISVRMAL